jgi:hypothetical protein
MSLDVMPSDVRKRAEVSKLAPHSIERAIDVARSIQHPWYRCQALANVGQAHPDKVTALRLIEESFRAAEEQDEVNRIVTVASWPLKVCVTLAPEMAQKYLTRLLALAAKEPHGLRRGDALHALLFAVAESPALKAQAIPPLVDTITAKHGWRIELLIADTATLIRFDHPEYLPRLLAAHPENRRKRKLLEALGGTESV